VEKYHFRGRAGAKIGILKIKIYTSAYFRALSAGRKYKRRFVYGTVIIGVNLHLNSNISVLRYSVADNKIM
jgi:hypothetical protein